MKLNLTTWSAGPTPTIPNLYQAWGAYRKSNGADPFYMGAGRPWLIRSWKVYWTDN